MAWHLIQASKVETKGTSINETAVADNDVNSTVTNITAAAEDTTAMSTADTELAINNSSTPASTTPIEEAVEATTLTSGKGVIYFLYFPQFQKVLKHLNAEFCAVFLFLKYKP
jgi:hypothetical protein